MKVVVTGGAGFIGSHLVEELILKGHQVHVVDNLVSGDKHNIHPKAIMHYMSICSKDVKQLFLLEKPDVVFHVAAQADVGRSMCDAVFDADVNIIGTINILDACKEASVNKIIFSSTSAVYGDDNIEQIKEEQIPKPISYYGLSKWTAESYIRLYGYHYGISYAILRYANVYGPRQSVKGEGGVIAIFIDKLIKGGSISIHGDGEQTRDYVYVKDVVQANISAMKKGEQEIFHVSTGEKTSVNQLVKMLEEIHGENIATVKARRREGDIQHSCLSNTKAQHLLQWEPKFAIVDGLKKTYEFS